MSEHILRAVELSWCEKCVKEGRERANRAMGMRAWEQEGEFNLKVEHNEWGKVKTLLPKGHFKYTYFLQAEANIHKTQFQKK